MYYIFKMYVRNVRNLINYVLSGKEVSSEFIHTSHKKTHMNTVSCNENGLSKKHLRSFVWIMPTWSDSNGQIVNHSHLKVKQNQFNCQISLERNAFA